MKLVKDRECGSQVKPVDRAGSTTRVFSVILGGSAFGLDVRDDWADVVRDRVLTAQILCNLDLNTLKRFSSDL